LRLLLVLRHSQDDYFHLDPKTAVLL